MFLVGTTPLKKEMLNTEKCYMLDCSAEIFIWMGRNTSLTERKMSISVTEVRNVYASICYMYFLALSKVYVLCLFVYCRLVCAPWVCIHLFSLVCVQILSWMTVYVFHEVYADTHLILQYDYVLVYDLWMLNIFFCYTFCDHGCLYLCIFHLYADACCKFISI